MLRENWNQVTEDLLDSTDPDFTATIYRNNRHHPSQELARRPSHLPSRSGWSVYGDLPRSPIRGIRNFATAEQAAAEVERMFHRYRERMQREDISAQDLKAEIAAVRRTEDEKYRAQVAYEHSRNGRNAAAPRPIGHHGLQLGLLS